MGNLSKPVVASLAGVAAALLVLIGSAGPWARVWFITVSGLDGDGKITAALALVAGGLLAYRAARPISSRLIAIAAMVGFVVCLAFGVYYLVDLQSLVGETQAEDTFIVVQVGWGLYVLVLGALGGVIASVLSIRGNATEEPQETQTSPLPSEA